MTTEAGLITGNLYQVPSRWFLPEGLFQTSCDSSNMHYVGSGSSVVQGSSIGTDLRGAMGSTIGEFCERYCAAHEPANRLVVASYTQLVAQYGAQAVFAPADYRLYADWQYAQPGFPYKPYSAYDEIAWVNGHDILTDKAILVPAYLVYMPHDSVRYDQGVAYALQTSTGIATGRTTAEAVQGGFLECAERHAFTSFWYKQLTLPALPTYAAGTIVRAYPEHEWVQRLYGNPRVQLQVFDLGSLGPVETVVVFLRYRYKNQERLSMGAASRFTKPEALIKAALEAYQGIEYGIMLDKQEKDWTTNQADFTNVNDFHKHFLFYNRFPELQAQVPILQQMYASATAPRVEVYAGAERMNTMAEAERTGLKHLIAVEITTPDVHDLGLKVVRMLTPGWAYLTGLHDRPFLGASVFGHPDELFTHLPHPFP